MIRERIARFIRTGDGDFGSLALELHAWQRENNSDLAAFVAGSPPTRWEDIPAVPVALFRDLSLTSFDPAETAVVFRTSGTTSGRRGAVRLRDTELYDLGARLQIEPDDGTAGHDRLFAVRRKRDAIEPVAARLAEVHQLAAQTLLDAPHDNRGVFAHFRVIPRP